LAGLNKTHIVSPNIDTILKPGEQELLQIHLNSPVHLRDIDSAIKEAAGNKDRAELDVATVLDNLRKIETVSSSTIYWITGISILILIFLMICCYYYRSFVFKKCRECLIRRAFGQNRFPRSRPRTNINARHSGGFISTLETVLPLHVIESTHEGEEQDDAETDLNAVSRAPTPFVSRRGVPVA
jgi:hypothetical protein